MRRSICSVALLALLPLSTVIIDALPAGIEVKITGGPSKTPQSKCFNHEAVEKGDVVVMNFKAYIADDSPAGTPGTFITSSKEHSDDGGPIAVPVGSDAVHPSWDLALLGLCEKDKASITIPHSYTKGQVFRGKNLPAEASVRIEVEVVDILIENSSDDSDSNDGDSDSVDSSDSGDEL